MTPELVEELKKISEGFNDINMQITEFIRPLGCKVDEYFTRLLEIADETKDPRILKTIQILNEGTLESWINAEDSLDFLDYISGEN
ncbi:hypothetical protein P9VFCI_060 [Rhizobium phage P9VFCI]|uniref:Uncharacterized protein n=2 Tax=Innesvirus TaxID=3044739 RepID=A0A076YM18_9CAUD|nr:hypothetical protein P10VF_232 [Rhizobium phage vB_RleM_P10VF]YP_010661953.1 hypothetical protein PP937_gp060 [Rhizobium phage P9VFCI]AIK68445.1 hypothetical protein P10VF_232 [Rhizobium phage vB_RleM_P10VF]QNH71965.1 hypothetical protein P9VFCI_060 [Rhizobium phage P9VFCI]